MYILVTGGLGYIGSHIVVELLKKNFNVIIIDNLSNSSIKVLDRINLLTNITPLFYQIDIIDINRLNWLFQNYKILSVIHLAGLKAVGESVKEPLYYYYNNISGSINLFNVMKKFKVFNIVFSSSATVYGKNMTNPITEKNQLNPINTYGKTKLYIENVLLDLHNSDNRWNIIILRYFNPVGAHLSGLIGENPALIPNNLMPYITQVAIGKLPKLFIYGNDYKTNDGTGVRDYIHVVDLANGHIKALIYMQNKNICEIFNLGTGKGYSVLELVAMFESVSGVKINYEIVKRRDGDLDIIYADSQLARDKLEFSTKYELQQMCIDSWKFQQKNPNGIQ